MNDEDRTATDDSVGHAWEPMAIGSSMDRCSAGCDWRRLRLSQLFTGADHKILTFVRGRVSAGIDERRWTDTEPPCARGVLVEAVTTAAWCRIHAAHHPNVHVLYDFLTDWTHPESPASPPWVEDAFTVDGVPVACLTGGVTGVTDGAPVPALPSPPRRSFGDIAMIFVFVAAISFLVGVVLILTLSRAV